MGRGDPKKSTTGRKGRRRPLLLRRVLFRRLGPRTSLLARILLGAPLVALLLVVLATQTGLLAGLVVPRLESALGLDIHADRIYVNRRGHVVMHAVRVRVPNVDGPAGRFLDVERLDADIAWADLLAGKLTVRTLTASSPVVRVSLSLDDGTLNMGHIPVRPDGRIDRLPSIIIRDAALELGEHRAQAAGDEDPDGRRPGPMYRPLKRIQVEGALAPVQQARDVRYNVRLRELTTRPGAPLALEGILTDDGLETRLTGLRLEHWPPQSVPTPTRDIFQALRLEGDVSETLFRYTRGEGVEVAITLAGGAMNVPLQVEGQSPDAGGFAAPGEYIRVKDVDGKIVFAPEGVRAELDGRFEDLPLKVALRTEGLALDSSFRLELLSEGFLLEQNPDLLPYAPPLVRQRVQDFSSPTARVDARVIAQRGAPGPDGPAAIDFEGQVRFRDGRAAFDRFPYTFGAMSGLVRFDTERIDVLEVTGRGPTGAALHATAAIAPPTKDAEVVIEIDVHGVPIDDVLRAALGEELDLLLPLLIDEQHLASLYEDGLVLAPAEADRLRRRLEQSRRAGAAPQRIAELEDALNTPVFEPGGTANARVAVHRPYGPADRWRVGVEVTVPKIGLVPSNFPLPIIGRDVHVLFEGTSVALRGGSFTTVHGRPLDVAIRVDLPGLYDGPGRVRAEPDLRIAADNVPVGPLLLRALPGDAPEGGLSARGIVSALGLRGAVDAIIHIANRDDDQIGFDVLVTADNIAARPDPGPDQPALALEGLAGTVEVTERIVRFLLAADVAPPPHDSPTPHPPGRMELDALVSYAPGPMDFRADITFNNLDLQSPVEHVLAILSEEAAGQARDLRRRFAPAGLADATASVAGGDEQELSGTVSLLGARGLSFDALGGRIAMDRASGRAWATLADPLIARFDRFNAPISLDGEPPTELQLDGAAVIDGDTLDAHPDQPLSIRADTRLESILVRRVLRGVVGGDALERFDRADPVGPFRYEGTLRASDQGGRWTSTLTPGRGEPFAFTHAGRRIMLPDLQGAFHFLPGAARWEDIRARARGWEAGGDGRARLAEGGAIVQSDLWLRAEGVGEELRALLPPELIDALDTLSFRAEGPVELLDGAISYAAAAGRDGPLLDFTGTLAARGFSFRAGMEFTDASATAHTRVEGRGDGPPRYTIHVADASARAAGVALTNLSALIIGNESPGEVTVTDLEADCYGGRAAAAVLVEPAGDGPDAPRHYEAQFTLGSVRFGPLQDDLRRHLLDDDDGQDADGPPWDRSRGLLDATISIAGDLDNDAALRGSGEAKVSHGMVLRLPLVMPLVEVVNLALPAGARLDLAEAAFFIDPDRVRFESLRVYSDMIEIYGQGSLWLQDWELDLRLYSRALRPVPVLGRFIEWIRDELVSVSVTGPLGRHVISLDQFRGARRAEPEFQRRQRNPRPGGPPPTPEGSTIQTIGPAPHAAGRDDGP